MYEHVCCCTILLTNFLPCYINTSTLRACLHGGGGLQVGEVTCGGSPRLSCKRDQIKCEIIWTGGLPHLSGLPHLPGVPHFHVNRLQVMQVLFVTHVIFFSDGKAIFFLYPAFANPRDGSPQEIDDPNAKLFFICSQEPANFALTGRLKLLLVPERKLVPPAASILNHPENQVHSFRLSR